MAEDFVLVTYQRNFYSAYTFAVEIMLRLKEAAERQLRRDKDLLRWIEQERPVMVALYRPSIGLSVEEDNADKYDALKAVRRLSRRKV